MNQKEKGNNNNVIVEDNQEEEELPPLPLDEDDIASYDNVNGNDNDNLFGQIMMNRDMEKSKKAEVYRPNAYYDLDSKIKIKNCFKKHIEDRRLPSKDEIIKELNNENTLKCLRSYRTQIIKDTVAKKKKAGRNFEQEIAFRIYNYIKTTINYEKSRERKNQI